MVFFVLTRPGYKELLRQLGKPPSPLWVNEGVLSAAELAQLRREGTDVTNFTYVIDTKDPVGLSNAVQTIQEHHEGHSVWVEYAHDL